jgi:hypothetical protein
MQIKEIKLQRGRSTIAGNTISLNIKGSLAGEENLQQVEDLFKKLLQAGIGIARLTVGKPEIIKRTVFPSRDQWIELKRLIVKKIGTDEGDEIDNYIREEARVNRVDLLTAGEMDELIHKISA